MLLKGITVASALLSLLLCALTGNFESLHWLWALPLSFVGIHLLLVILAFLFLCLICKLVDLSVPQEHDSPFYRKATDLYVEAALTLLHTKIHTQGLEKIPEGGRFLVVSNHLSFMDPVMLLRYFQGHQLAFISKKENRNMFIIGKIMHKLMCQPIDRENDREALKTIIRCIKLLKEDEASVAVFPEGYISKDRKLHHFRSGVFKIATKAQVPIVVCTLKNTHTILPNAKNLKRAEVWFHVVDVIPAEGLKDRTTVDIAEQVYDLMLGDLGPEFAPEQADNT